MIDSHIIIELVQQIKVAVVQVKVNKKKCQLLADRVGRVGQQIASLTAQMQSQSYQAPLLRLYNLLQECKKFIDSFSQEKLWKKFIFGSDHNDKFDAYNEQLKESIEELQLGLNMELLFNSANDREAEKTDDKEINEKLAEICRLNYAGLDKLSELAQMQEKNFQALQARLAMMSLGEGAVDVADRLKKRHQIAAQNIVFNNLLMSLADGQFYHGGFLTQPVLLKKMVFATVDMQQLFLREVAVIARLAHRNILQFYGACFEPEKQCLVMAPVKDSLLSFLQKNNSSLIQRRDFALGIASGLFYLHARGVIHNRLAIEHIMLDENDTVKIINFGWAQIDATSVRALKVAPSTNNPVSWLAPEQLTLGYVPNSAADVYSFGLVLWSIFTGQQPYAGYDTSQIMQLKSSGKTPEIPAIIPDSIRTLMQDCWQPSAARPNMAEISERLVQMQVAAANDPNYDAGIVAERNKNFVAAVQCYQQAIATSNCMKSKTNLATFYREGKGGLPKDPLKAFQLLSEAAKAGHDRAMYNLAMSYEHGVGTTKNLAEAKKWYEKAANNNFPNAKEQLVKLANL